MRFGVLVVCADEAIGHVLNFAETSCEKIVLAQVHCIGYLSLPLSLTPSSKEETRITFESKCSLLPQKQVI